jgi:hypothetical protein
MIHIPPSKTSAAFVALYNASHQQGMGHMHAPMSRMSIDEADFHLAQDTYIDYHRGRVIKTDFSGGETSTALYNRDNGEGAAERVLRQAGVIE